MLRTTLGVLAIIALATGLVRTSSWKWITAAIAFSGLYSSILRHCTPYSILGISTAEDDKSAENNKSVQEFYSHKQYIRRY